MRTQADMHEQGIAIDSGGAPRALRHAVLIAVVFIACLCLVAMAAGQTVAGQTADESADARVREAIVDAVRTRMGTGVEVTLTNVRIRLVGELPDTLSIVPDSGAQTGGPVHFMLLDAAARPRRVGSVDAKLFVKGPRVLARTEIARGTQVGAADIDAAIGDVGRQPIKPLVPATQVIGARAVRAIAAGEVITPRLLALTPLVQSGDEVRTRVRIGELEARGQAIAAQNGALGQEIILIADSKRRLKGRVIGEREVEVLHEE